MDLLSPRIYAKLLSPNSHLIINFKEIKEEMKEYINKNNINASIYVENLRSGAFFEINASQSYPVASLNKLPLSILILKKVEEGKLSLNDEIDIMIEDRNDYFGELYKNPIGKLSVKELLYYMLVDSDNTATNVLEGLVKKEDLDSLEEYINFYCNDIISEKAPLKTTEANPQNISNIFISLYLSTILEPNYSELILDYLSNNSFDIKKYANLPESVTVSHKHGLQYTDNKKFFHDCGILYIGESRFCYCIMTKGIELEKTNEVIGKIVNMIYKFILEKRKK